MTPPWYFWAIHILCFSIWLLNSFYLHRREKLLAEQQASLDAFYHTVMLPWAIAHLVDAIDENTDPEKQATLLQMKAKLIGEGLLPPDKTNTH